MIYLASPFNHPDPLVREQRFQAASRAAAALVRAGVTVFSPIAHSYPIALHGVPTTWEYWARVDCELLSKCDVLAVLMLPGWDNSAGVQAEIAWAQELGLPIVYLTLAEPDAQNCANWIEVTA